MLKGVACTKKKAKVQSRVIQIKQMTVYDRLPGEEGIDQVSLKIVKYKSVMTYLIADWKQLKNPRVRGQSLGLLQIQPTGEGVLHQQGSIGHWLGGTDDCCMYTSEAGFQLKLNRTGTDVKRLIVQAAGPLRLQMQQKTYFGDFKA